MMSKKKKKGGNQLRPLCSQREKKTRICTTLPELATEVALDNSGTTPCFVPRTEWALSRPAVKLVLLLTDLRELPAAVVSPEKGEVRILTEDAVERRHRVLL